MKLDKLSPPKINWDTVYAPHDHINEVHDCNGFCEHTGVHQVLDMSTIRPLNEATYKEIASLIDGNFLNQKIRADALKGIHLDGFEDNTMLYTIESSKFQNNRIRYQCRVQFDEWDDIAQDTDFNFVEKSRMLLWVGNIRLHCTCPSFLYWGYQYLLSAIDASVYPEERKPEIRNPGERGIVCKHLNRILRVLPFYSGQIAKELKIQYGVQ